MYKVKYFYYEYINDQSIFYFILFCLLTFSILFVYFVYFKQKTILKLGTHIMYLPKNLFQVVTIYVYHNKNFFNVSKRRYLDHLFAAGVTTFWSNC